MSDLNATDPTAVAPATTESAPTPETPAPVSTATEAAPAVSQPAAPAPVAAEPTIAFTPEQLQSLIATAVSQAVAEARQGSSPVSAKPKTLVTSDTVKAVGDIVVHNGRPAMILEVLSTERDEDGDAHDQYLYRVGVFAEDRILDAEDFGTL